MEIDFKKLEKENAKRDVELELMSYMYESFNVLFDIGVSAFQSDNVSEEVKEHALMQTRMAVVAGVLIENYIEGLKDGGKNLRIIDNLKLFELMCNPEAFWG